MNFEELRSSCLQCRKCDLAESRTQVVFGTGNPGARIVFVGEAPGKNEDETGIPFVGQAGKMLDNFLVAVGLHRDDIYIANIIKCRPPANRDPLPDEQNRCIGWLEQQLELIAPDIIVCLGRIAAKRLIDENFLVTQDHGKLYTINGYTMMGTFHPAALLRNPASKGPTLEDFKKIAELIRRK